MPRITLTIAGLLIFASNALAAPATKQLYHWVGADGKDHYSDVLPPEALNQAREEINAKNGMTVNKVDRALTVDERTAAQAKAAADARAAETAEKAKQSDQVLLSSYPTEAELKHAYDDRLDQQAESLKTTRLGLKTQQQSLSALLIAASNIELSGKPVSTQMTKSIQTTHVQVLAQEQLEVQQEAQSASLRRESSATLEHYRSLRSASDAEHAGAAPATTPPKG